MSLYVYAHSGYEKDGLTDYSVWEDDDDQFGPLYVGLTREDCEAWIAKQPTTAKEPRA